MFTPLAYNKNTQIEIDRFDNSGYSTDTSVKAMGIGIPDTDFYSIGSGCNAGTIAVQAFPNASDTKSPYGAESKWLFWSHEASSVSAWWQLYIAGADNTQIGGGSNYSMLDNTVGTPKGGFFVSLRERSGGGGNNDGLLWLNSGSDWASGEGLYDWDNPEPIRIAITFKKDTPVNEGTFYASLNGQTMTATWENRSGYNVQARKWLCDICPTGQDVKIGHGYSTKVQRTGVDSGSFSEITYFTSSLSQEEMNAITAQPYGAPLNFLSKRNDASKENEANVDYVIRQENKVQTSGDTITSQLNGVFAYANKGQTSDAPTQAKTVADSLANVTSGSALNTELDEYRLRE